MARAVTGMVVETVTRGAARRNSDTSAISSDVVQAICYGSSARRGTGSRPETRRGLGLKGALDEAVRAALPEPACAS